MDDQIGHHIIRLRPDRPAAYASQGYVALTTDINGFVEDNTIEGLFVHETRMLSRLRHLIDGELPIPVALSNVKQHSWLGYYIMLPPGFDAGEADKGSGQLSHASQNTLELRVSRYVGSGIHEDLDLTNFSQEPTSFTFAIELDADFADLVEVGSGERQQQGDLTRDWRESPGEGVWELVFDYHAEHDYDHQGNVGTAELHRGLVFRVRNAGSAPTYRGGQIRFRVELAPHATWHTCIDLLPRVDGREMPPAYGCRSFGSGDSAADRQRATFVREATHFETPSSQTLSHAVVRTLEQATRDLAALRLDGREHGERAWVPAAGLPLYIALFGRDTLTVGWQAALVSPDLLRGTLPELASLQGRDFNDWRDEQPGKMLHEAHTGPLAMLNFNPRHRYYGSLTTSGFYPVALSELWHWTGDRETVEPLIAPALEALHWLDEFGDLDGDGFYEYQTRSAQGVKHQAWKDSGDAVVYADGSQVEPPIATCEEQGFVYMAKLHMAELLWWFDQRDIARQLYREAGELKKRFNDAFWMPDEGFFAMGLDPDKRQIKAITSNPGHCIATAIVDQDTVQQTCARLFEPDLFTGWGIRTLSAANPAYNPYSYHRGSVWPVEQGTFALGFMRYGLHQYAQQLSCAQFEAAALFDFFRLPEVFSGHQRDADHPFPALYPQSNSPQAWSASAAYSMLQAMLGLYPYAPLNLLLVDPHLPDWLPEITLRGLRVGEARADLRFFRDASSGDSGYEVLDVEGTLHVLRQATPWSLSTNLGERLVDALSSLLPG